MKVIRMEGRAFPAIEWGGHETMLRKGEHEIAVENKIGIASRYFTIILGN